MLDVTKFVEGLHDYIGRALAPVAQRLKVLEDRAPVPGPAGERGADGKDADPAIIKAAVSEAVAAIPRPRDGADGVDGKDAAPVDIAQIVREVVALVPAPKDGNHGRDGIDADPEAIRAEVARAVAALPKPSNGRDGIDGKDGDSVQLKDIEPLVEARAESLFAKWALEFERRGFEMLQRAADKMPAPKDGKDADPAMVKQCVADAVAAIPRPQDGRSVSVDDVRPVLADLVKVAVADIPPAKDGVSVTVDDVRPLVESKVSEWALEFERRAADVMQKAIDRMPVPKDGRDGLDGFGFDDMTAEQKDEGRTMVLKFAREGRERVFELRTAVVIDRGVYRAGEYLAGDAVTYGGSLWIAQRDTHEAPGSGSKDWRLAVKRGRDGKDAA